MPRARTERALRAPVAALRRSPGSRLRVEETLEANDLAVSGSRVPEGSPVRVDLTLEPVHDGILVSGSVRAAWEGECRRCLEEARGPLEIAVRELCVAGSDDETTYPIENDEIDLGVIVHDAAILNLPLAPLCREDCRGLCPDCGVNRNLEPCPHGRLVVIEGGAGHDETAPEEP
jgi:uncharacterized protein